LAIDRCWEGQKPQHPLAPAPLNMKKDQRYQRIEQVGEEEAVNQPYHDDPREDDGNNDHQLVSSRTSQSYHASIPLTRSHSTQSGSLSQGSYADEPETASRGDGYNEGNNLRIRRKSNELVTVEGDIEATLAANGKKGPTPRSLRMKDDINSQSDGSSSEELIENVEDEVKSRGEEGNGLFCASHGSSFDLMDDEDEVNLQRYHLDFSSAPYSSSFQGEQIWEEGMDGSSNMYHPRRDTTGSYSKDPWIRLVQQQNQQSPTNGNIAFSSIKSFDDLFLYLNSVRCQARHRRAQRLLTMPSEQWWQRFQFSFMTYCCDFSDVGLLVIAILLVIWFTGLLWLARLNVRKEKSLTTDESQSGTEYNQNAEFDDYNQDTSSLYLIFQWWWWGLGFVLLIRILGPFAAQNLNQRRRQRRRQRFMSDNMQQQQNQEQHQQFSMSASGNHNGIDPDFGELEENEGPPSDLDDSEIGLEIPTTKTPSAKASSSF
jgi:hypothetical protein